MLLILYNSTSGKGKGKTIAEHVFSILSTKKTPYDSFRDEHWPNHIDQYEIIWIIGGDGTINFFLNKYPNSRLPLGIFPGGTGNDFYANFQDHFDIEKLVDNYLNCHIKKVDIGICNGDRFINTIGIGFDGEVLKDMGLVRWIGGHLGYLIIIIKHLFTYKENWFNYAKEDQQIREKLLLFFVSNAPTTGGGFIISPKAKIDDGLLNVITAKPTSKFQRILLLPKVEKGTHLSHQKVTHWTTKNITIKMEKSVYYQIDGELKSSQHFSISLLEKALEVLI